MKHKKIKLSKTRKIKEKKGELYFPDTKSCVTFVKKKDYILIPHIRSHFSGDAHLLTTELYRKFPNKLFKTDVRIAFDRKKALKFWKSEGFKITNRLKQAGISFYEMEKR